MTGLRILSFCIGIIIMLPMIAVSLWGFNMTQWVNNEVARNDAILNDAAVIPDAMPMPTNPLDWLRSRADLRDTFTRDEITSDRIVVVQEIIDDTDLLRPGETLPDPVFLELYANARAPARLIAYCPDVLSAIGTACDVLRSEVRENRNGKLVLTGHLGFRPVAVLGDPSKVQEGVLISGRVELPYSGDLRPANEPASRIKAMQDAQAICDQLRRQYGNCVLSRVSFDIDELWITDLEVLPPGTNPQRLRTSATFKVYADSATLDHLSLMEQLHEMAKRS